MMTNAVNDAELLKKMQKLTNAVNNDDDKMQKLCNTVNNDDDKR